MSGHEPLADLGVDSLTVAEVLEALAHALGRELPLAWWFEAASLADLADRWAGGSADQRRAAALGQARDDLAMRPNLDLPPWRRAGVPRIRPPGATVPRWPAAPARARWPARARALDSPASGTGSGA